MVAQHTRTENPYQLLYQVLGISQPSEPRTKPACCDSPGQPPIEPDLAARFEQGLRSLTSGADPGPAKQLSGAAERHDQVMKTSYLVGNST